MEDEKVTRVVLVAGDESKEFDLTHAQDILNYQEEKKFTTGWQLKPNSGFQYKNGTINPTNSGAAEESEEQIGDSGRGKP